MRKILILMAVTAMLSTGCYRCVQVRVSASAFIPTPISGGVQVVIHK